MLEDGSNSVAMKVVEIERSEQNGCERKVQPF